MVQAEWTMEVKHMAKKTASGQLRFPPPCQPGEWTSSSSESETDGGPAEEPSGLSQSDSEAGSQPERGPEEVRQLTSGGEGESDPGMEPMRFRGSQSQRKSIPRFATEVTLTGHGVTSHKSVSLSATTEDLCTGQKREDLVHSPLSSLNESEEFFTPDSEFFLGSSAPHDLSRQESPTVGEDLEVTQSLWGPEEHLEMSQGGRGEKERPMGALKGGERIPQEGEVRAHRPEGPGTGCVDHGCQHWN
ncbi:hypothetical protein JRQ81_008101 [Phrynocephalus forsythii]|uniref:Uncharacterized protein n=1 Tax=Phrynocephalus forsythii TaxID=171643 RepID=A0A9Q1ASK7_9SAUR|nr:hypothetical protein JRQ81_008101 [Phrynocephalus forsythii]